VKGKTGMRRIRLIESVPDLQHWLVVHPERENPGAPPLPLQEGEGFMTVERLNAPAQGRRPEGRDKQASAPPPPEAHQGHPPGQGPDGESDAGLLRLGPHLRGPRQLRPPLGEGVDDTLARLRDGGRPEREVCPRCGFRNPEGGLYCSRC